MSANKEQDQRLDALEDRVSKIENAVGLTSDAPAVGIVHEKPAPGEIPGEGEQPEA